MATVVLDLPRIATFTSLPQNQIDQLLSAPTVELVQQLLVNISKKAKEFEESASSRLKLRVELGNANRSHDAKVKVFKNSLEKATEENTKLREHLKTSEALKQSVAAEVELIKSSSSTSESESNTLRARIAALEGSQRDSAALLEKRSTAYDDLANELSVKHQKTVELRREIATLEQEFSSVNSKSNSWKIREQELQQEIEALKTHNEWLDQELKTRNTEHSRFRKEKNARLSELQQQYEDSASSIEGLQRTEQIIRTRLQEVSQKSDEYLQQAQSLREEYARKEDNYRTELDTANRYSELLQDSIATERQRREDLAVQIEEHRQAAADEIGRIGSEIDAEHEERLEAERRVAELEVEVERLTADLDVSKHPPAVSSTPKAKMNGSNIGTPRNGSPMPSSRGGINYTQLVSDYHVAKSDLETEKRRTHELSSRLDEIMRDLELRQPELDAAEAEHARLEADVLQLTRHVDIVSQERDEFRKESKKSEREINGLAKEGELLRQQLRDLSSQIKVLLMEAHARDQGISNLSSEQRAALETFAQGDLDGEGAENVTDTHRFISEHLTTFKRIKELQENNAKLVRLTRELGEQMEGEEAQLEKAQAAQDREDLIDLRTKYEKAKDEIKILTTQSISFTNERDMFRRMLSHRGKLPAGDNVANFGESINGTSNPSTPARRDSIAAFGSPSSKEMTDLTKAIKELQSQYDTYKNDAAQHQRILKQQSDTLAQHNIDLRNEVSKKTNESTLATDRYEMLHGNYGMLKSENQELQKRAQLLSERASKQEMKTQQVAEDLVEIKSTAESLRNETANLKAEREFWKTIEKRLNNEVAGLTADRDRLNVLNTSMQSILNENEHTDKESRRRLQSQIETLEADLQTARQKLDNEIEESKRITFRKEYEAQQSSVRIEELMMTLATVREELVAAQTTRDHLQSRIEELGIDLRSTQETLEIYRPKPADSQPTSTDGVPKEQELALEVSELKRVLNTTQKELVDNKALIDQFKSISQHAEEELKSMNNTYEEYRSETDTQLEEAANKIKVAEDMIETLRSEIRNINGELLAANEKVSEHSQQIQTQKTTYDSDLAELRESTELAQAAIKYHQEDLRKQAEIAQQAQQNYDNELLKHAEATRTLQITRTELNQFKLEAVEYRLAAEAAETKLQQNEESWTDMKERYERELTEIRSRKDNASAQNELLHAQLEKVNKNIGELRQKRTSDIGITTTTPDGDADVDNQNLNELVKYLQREKTIADTQYLRAQQESKRLQQQLEHTQTQLDEVRLKLAQAQKLSENNETQTMNHTKLMETLQELNLYRESNTTLRIEKHAVETALSQRTNNLEMSQLQILPLQSRIAELEGVKDMLETDVRLASEAKDRFEKRYLDILNRSNAVDPAEFEAKKQKLIELEAERDQLLETRNALQQELDLQPAKAQGELDQQKIQNDERMAKFKDQAKEKNRTQNAAIKEKENALQVATKEKEELASQLESIQVQFAEAIDSKNQAEAKLAEQVKQVLPTPTIQNEQNTEPSPDALEALKSQLTEAQNKAESEQQRAEGVSQQLVTAEQRIVELEAEMLSLNETLKNIGVENAEIKTRLEESISRVETSQTQDHSALEALQESLNAANTVITNLTSQIQDKNIISTPESDSVDLDEVFAGLQTQLRQLESEAEDLKAKLQALEVAKDVTVDGSISIADQITSQVDLIRRELTRRHDERVKVEEDRFKKRADKMKEALNKQISKLKDTSRASLSSTSTDTLDNLTKAHVEEIQTLNLRHADEMAELQRHIKSSDEDTNAKSQSSVKFEPTEEQIRELLKSNAYARKLVQNSLDNRTKKAQEDEQLKTEVILKTKQKENAEVLQVELAKVRAEEQKKLDEQIKGLDEKIAKARQDAEALIKKKYDVKFSMTENRMNMAVAKVNYVQKAAKDTPNEAVSKVWEAAKDLKPAPKPAVIVPSQSVQSGGPGLSTTISSTIPVGSSSSTTITPKGAAGIFNQAKSDISKPTFGLPSTHLSSGIQRPSGFGQPSGQQQQHPGLTALGISIPNSVANTGGGLQQSQHARGGRASGSAIPRGGGGGSAMRGARGVGSGIPRGGGRGGAIQPSSRAVIKPDPPESPQTPMNPSAAQFVPGQKRSIDSNEHVGGDEKRTKTE